MVLDLGTFVLFNIFGFIFFFIALSLKNTLAGVFNLIAMILFFGLALIVLLGDIIILIPTTTELHYDGASVLQFNSTVLERTQVIISADYSIILNAVYLGLGSFNLIIFLQKKWAVFGK